MPPVHSSPLPSSSTSWLRRPSDEMVLVLSSSKIRDRAVRGGLSLPLPATATDGSAMIQEHKPLLLVAACALVDADGRVLIAQRPEGKQLAGLWEFPGGKVEKGETPEACLIRELHEEIGVETQAACLAPLTFASHSYDDFHLLMPLYVCHRF